MSSLELNLKKKTRKSKIQKILLNSLYTAGIMSLAVFAPNAISILKKFNIGKKRKSNPKYSVRKAINRLRQKGLIVWEENKKGVFLRLTREGEQSLDLMERKEFKISIPKKWDSKWRIIIFDIKEERKGTREKLRNTLINIGFLKIQNSVWVYPYDCEELMTLIKADLKVGKDILYIIADSIENDSWVKKHFNLNT